MIMQDYKKFRALVQKVKQHRVHKINNSIGVYDAYKWVRKNNWLNLERPVTEKEFYSIIRTVNTIIADHISLGEEFKFPERLGILELRKYTPFIGYKDDKLKVSLAIDWAATLNLWFEDEEAYNNKTLVKIPEKEIFKFYYSKKTANYINKSFYSFQVNREIKKRLKTNIKEGKVDAFLL